MVATTVAEVTAHDPVLVNPGTNPTTRDLRGRAEDGVGRHWWRRLRAEDFYLHQLPDPVGPYVKPEQW